LILFNNDTYVWKFGIHFLSKFTLVFNTDSKTIGYYYGSIDDNEKIKTIENQNNMNLFLYILLIIFFLIIVSLLVFIIYLLARRKRKLKPNELEDEYDYSLNK
jgi:heme/copper-type cytochrome/quinol oxidase subunit 2